MSHGQCGVSVSLAVVWCSLGLLSQLFVSAEISAQSTIIQLPSPSPATSVDVNQPRIPNSFTLQQKDVEARLAAPTPAAWRSEKSMGNLVNMMNRSGFQVLLDESAADNNLDEHTVIRLALHNASIETNLRFALRLFQCDFLITESGILVILSYDAALDFDNMSRVTYDISRIVNHYDDLRELINLVQETVDPDSWDDNGGMGRQHATDSKKGFLLTVTQTFKNQRRVRQLLDTTLALGGGAVPLNDSQVHLAGSSRPVKLPEEYLALRRNRRGMALPGSGTTGGFGGGAGLGGGVF